MSKRENTRRGIERDGRRVEREIDVKGENTLREGCEGFDNRVQEGREGKGEGREGEEEGKVREGRG